MSNRPAEPGRRPSCTRPAVAKSNSCPIPCALNGFDGFYLTKWGLGTLAFLSDSSKRA
ncbi:protein of unknown function [Shinella sp. WSC3-e]|nr:hypothetical protein SHINE37_43863 [Rhizobiaceae bacterium]CAK7258393.1 protein of unknown function [Shinella sp. WSC3-e]